MPVTIHDEFFETPDEFENHEDERPEVLIIDDDNYILESLDILLQDEYSLLLCESGADGINAIHRGVYAVILDIKMQGKDGFQTFIELKRKNPYIPIIFHSAYQDLEDPYVIMNKYKPFGYIIKGSSNSLIEDTIKSAVDYYKQIRKNEILITRLESLTYALETKVDSGKNDECFDFNTYVIEQTSGFFKHWYFFARLYEELDKACETGTSAALLIIRFDPVESDEIVKNIGDLIRQNLNPDEIIGRLNHTDIGILMPGIDPDKGYDTANDLLQKLDSIESVTVSMGLCTYKEADSEIYNIFAQAKKTLEAAIQVEGNNLSSLKC